MTSIQSDGELGREVMHDHISADITDLTTTLDPRYLKLDQTTPQTTVGTFTFPIVHTPTINGGVLANDDITIQGTTHATRTTSYVILQPNGGNVGIGTTSPGAKLDVRGSAFFNEDGGDYDFRIESDSYDAFFVDASDNSVAVMNNASGKVGFFAATPIVKVTTAIAEIAFTENAGGTVVNVDSTFGGYTLQQVVQALKNYGLLT